MTFSSLLKALTAMAPRDTTSTNATAAKAMRRLRRRRILVFLSSFTLPRRKLTGVTSFSTRPTRKSISRASRQEGMAPARIRLLFRVWMPEYIR